MFQSARLQLTFWYLVIIMFISICFSTIIYRALETEIERFARIQRFRIERGIFDQEYAPDQLRPIPTTITIYDLDLVADIERRLLIALIFLNCTIFVISGGLAYILAGRTLRPIQEMVDEQHRFISDASHELKTPLTSLKSAFEVYLRDTKRTKSDADQLVKESIDEVDKLQSLSESLLQLAQVEQTYESVQLAPLQLTKVIELAVKQVQPLAKNKNIHIINHIEATEVIGDTHSLTQLFVILLDNAIKYSPSTSLIELNSSRIKNYAQVDVTDHGIGISKTEIEHIFDRFYRADSARTKLNGNGYGLGLSIAKQLVELNNAKIYVKSTLKKGTTFTVKLLASQ